MLKRLYQNRQLLLKSTIIELRKRYAGSLIGVGWLVLSPLILLAVYTVVYVFIFKLQPNGLRQMDYILYIFSGLVPLLAISEGFTSGLSSLLAEQNLWSSTNFPIEILTVRAVLTSFPSFVIGMGFILVSALVAGHPNFYMLLLPVVMIFQFFFVIGLSWIFSVTNLILRDVQQLINYVLMIAFIVSPIAYTPDMVPKRLAIFIWLNPLAYFAQAYQDLIVYGHLPPISHVIILIGMSVLAFLGGSRLFCRIRRGILEYA